MWKKLRSIIIDSENDPENDNLNGQIFDPFRKDLWLADSSRSHFGWSELTIYWIQGMPNLVYNKLLLIAISY